MILITIRRETCQRERLHRRQHWYSDRKKNQYSPYFQESYPWIHYCGCRQLLRRHIWMICVSSSSVVFVFVVRKRALATLVRYPLRLFSHILLYGQSVFLILSFSLLCQWMRMDCDCAFYHCHHHRNSGGEACLYVAEPSGEHSTSRNSNVLGWWELDCT